MSEPDSEFQPVAVADYDDPVALSFAKAALEEAGIYFYVQGENIGHRPIAGGYSFARPRLYASREHAAQARELLDGDA